MPKKPSNGLNKLNKELMQYLYPGYDLHFIHGWFCAYLSAPSDSEEDLFIPTYLILDETKIVDEEQFTKLIDTLVLLYSDLADAIFEKNKLIRPLIDFAKPNGFDPLLFTREHNRNLLVWLYGYLTGYLAIGGDILEYATDQNLLKERFFPSLFTLSVAFFRLSEQVELNFMSPEVRADFNELCVDLKAMWESEEDEDEDEFEVLIGEAIHDLDLADVIGALNDVFYVIRVSDEARFMAQNSANLLLGKLASRH